MYIDRKRAARAFDEYTSHYDMGNPRIALKASHTHRVADNADRIARSLDMGGEDVDLAWLLGILHDVGRFEQIRVYDTFNDRASESHAAISARVLFDEGRIRDYVDDTAEDELMRTAVATHSAYGVPDGLDERTHTFCDVLRDADKVDILKVNCIESREDIYGVSEEELDASPLSPAVIDAFYEHRTIPTAIKRHPADFIVGHICFAYGMVYPESLRMADEQGYLWKLLEIGFTDPETARTFTEMERHLRGWVTGRLA